MKVPIIFLFAMFTLSNFTLLDAGCCGRRKKKKESVIEAIKRKINDIVRGSDQAEEMQEEAQQSNEQVRPECCALGNCPCAPATVVSEVMEDEFVQDMSQEEAKRNEVIETVENVANEVMEDQNFQLTPAELAIVVNSLVDNIMSQAEEQENK